MQKIIPPWTTANQHKLVHDRLTTRSCERYIQFWTNRQNVGEKLYFYHSPISGGKQCFLIWKRHFHDYTEMQCPNFGEMLKTKYKIYQSVHFWMLFFGVHIETDAVYYYLLKGKILL